MKQYLVFSCPIFPQVLIWHATRVFGLMLLSPRQPGHAFLSLVYAQQRRQFIPQGAISVVRITFVFFDLIAVTFVDGITGCFRGRSVATALWKNSLEGHDDGLAIQLVIISTASFSIPMNPCQCIASHGSPEGSLPPLTNIIFLTGAFLSPRMIQDASLGLQILHASYS